MGGRRRQLIDPSSGEPIGAGAPSPRPSKALLEDAMRRNCAEVSITAELMGDPRPGQSALDKRQAGL